MLSEFRLWCMLSLYVTSFRLKYETQFYVRTFSCRSLIKYRPDDVLCVTRFGNFAIVRWLESIRLERRRRREDVDIFRNGYVPFDNTYFRSSHAQQLFASRAITFFSLSKILQNAIAYSQWNARCWFRIQHLVREMLIFLASRHTSSKRDIKKKKKKTHIYLLQHLNASLNRGVISNAA